MANEVNPTIANEVNPIANTEVTDQIDPAVMPPDALDDDEDFGETNFGDVPQEYTESYGTGVKDMPGWNIGGRSMHADQVHYADAELSGGDVDAAWGQIAIGEEEVGGTVATPDQDVVDELGAAVGLEMDDRAFLRTTEILEQRDDRRWELDPTSSEDYSDRRTEIIFGGDAELQREHELHSNPQENIGDKSGPDDEIELR